MLKKKKKGEVFRIICLVSLFFFFSICFSASLKESLLACTKMLKALRKRMRRVHPSLHLSLAKVQFNSEQRFGSCSQEHSCKE